MHVLILIAAKYPLPGYGGTERAAYWLGKALAEKGHKVSFCCHGDSQIPFADVIPMPEDLQDFDSVVPDSVDVVQLFATPAFPITKPYLVCIQGNGQAGEQYHQNTVFISRNHAERHGWTEFVYNGIALDEYPLETKKEDYALFLAKAKWKVKNLKGSLRIARAANRQLFIAGGKVGFWVRGAKGFGDVGGEFKLGLLQKASCLLFPVIWEEPFGIAMIEALACGTPVIGTPRGSIPEIVDPSCGVVANNFDELVAGVANAHKFSAEACRARVANNFSHHHMADGYLNYYERLLRDGRIREGNPQAAKDADPEKITLYQGY